MGTGKLSAKLADLERRQRASGATGTHGMLTSRGPNGIGRKPAWRPAPAAGRMFPFRVYRSSEGDTTGQDDGWRKVVVRSGRIGRTEVTGTDGATNPDSGDGSEMVIVVPSGQSAYPIWVEYIPATPAASINSAADPDAGDWPGYPGPCTTEGTICILIATINTSVNGSMEIRQLVRADLPDYYQACVNVSGSEKVINVACDGQPFDFV